MPKRERVALIEQTPSTVFLQKQGKRSTEKLLLEGDGINAMINEDGSVSLEVYNDRESIILRLSADDTKAQAHVLREWAKRS